MSILSAGTTNSTALNLTADTSGSLILASNNNVTAVTIATNQSVTFANNATFPTTIGVGGATPSANGAGISFPATQSASSDANTLDDYEEGTFTPTVTASGSIASFTYVAQFANYVKIGKTVYFSLNAEITSLAGGSSGNLRISSLPFTVSATSGYAAVVMGYISQTGGTVPNGALAVSNQSYIQFYNNNAGSVTAIGFGALSAFNYHIAGTYTTT